MIVQTLRSDRIYRKVAQSAPEGRLELFRNEFMAPFMKQWQIQQIPFKAEEANGFDVITFNSMMHRSPDRITRHISSEIESISSDSLWLEWEQAVRKSLRLFYRDRKPSKNFEPVHMPYSAGYACGYHVMQYYLRKTGKTIFEATITPAAQILDEAKGFGDEETIING